MRSCREVWGIPEQGSQGKSSGEGNKGEIIWAPRSWLVVIGDMRLLGVGTLPVKA